MASATVTMQHLQIYTLAPNTNFGGQAAAVVRDTGIQAVILCQVTLPAEVPTDISVSNARVEADLAQAAASGTAELRKQKGGFYLSRSTWNHLDPDAGRAWANGPFSSADYAESFWSGALTLDDPQTYAGGSGLAAYIESAAAGDRRVNLCFIAFVVAFRQADAVRLKFDWTGAGQPAVTGFTPGSMNSGATPAMTVSGINFVGTLTSVQMVGASTYNLTGVSIVNETTITGTVPGGVAVGSYVVRVNISGQPAADSSQTFTVNSTTPTITGVSGPQGAGFIRNSFKQTLTVTGASLSGATNLRLIGQGGQGTHELTNLSSAAGQVTGLMPDPPIPPGKYVAQVVCTAGTVTSGEIDVCLGPAWW